MNWKKILDPVLSSSKMLETKAFLQNERKTKNIYPEGIDTFKAFELCPFEKTRVIIIGQDPYHTKGTAHGLAFSTKQEQRPPSLEVIFKEIYKDLNIQYYYNKFYEEFFPTNDLTKWAQNGFLLLNSSLTVEEGKPGSHSHLGWDMVIKQAIEGLNQKEKMVIFLLWGNEAKKFKEHINTKHAVFTANHPASELYKDGNGGFYGCRHFSIIRDCLPIIEGNDLFPTISLDSCFDKEKAKKIVMENYPIDAEQICKYIDQDMLIHAPVNHDIYWREIRKFEEMLSTKY